MSNISAKKQNRILLIALITVLACTAVLIAVTGSANKKKNEKTPPINSETTETVIENETKDKNAAIIGSEAKEKSPESEKAKDITEEIEDKAPENKKTTEAQTEKNDTEVSSMADDSLPRFASPVSGIVIKDYSDNVPVFSYTMNDYRVHNGLDFAASVGTPVYASADGMVCEMVDDPMMGICVSLSHSGGAVTKYKGLSEESMNMLSVGDAVSCGQVIGSAGDTALIESAEENHVHFELSVNGEAQNPADYFSVTYLSDLTED